MGKKISVSFYQRILLNLGERKQNTGQNFRSFPGASPHPQAYTLTMAALPAHGLRLSVSLLFREI